MWHKSQKSILPVDYLVLGQGIRIIKTEKNIDVVRIPAVATLIGKDAYKRSNQKLIISVLHYYFVCLNLTVAKNSCWIP